MIDLNSQVVINWSSTVFCGRFTVFFSTLQLLC